MWRSSVVAKGGDKNQSGAAALYERGTACASEGKKEEAFALFKEAADVGLARAINSVGVCFANGVGVRKDEVKAVAYFKEAAGKKDARGMFNLANAFSKGQGGLDKDEAKAVELYQAAFKHGDVDSAFNLGMCFATGTSQDARAAAKWYQKAADLKHVRAANSLGVCYMTGFGVERNMEKAAQLFQRAADNGDVGAMHNLGSALARGEGLKKDEFKAFEWFSKASDEGHADSSYALGVFYLLGTGTEQNEQRAFELFSDAAGKDHAGAMFKLGQFYEIGTHVARDVATALYFYKKASQQGHKNALTSYRQLLSDCLPASVKQSGAKQIEQYVNDLIDGGSTVWPSAKIMVLGKESVGKTHLLHRIRGRVYSRNVSTEGIDVHKFKLNGLELTWFDFGGQAVFYPTHQFFLTSHCVYLIVFRLDDPDAHERLAYWLKSVGNFTNDSARPAKVVIVGTHADLVPSQEEQDSIWERLRPLMEGGNVVGHVAVSCTSGKAAVGGGIDGVIRGIEMAIESAKLSSIQVPRTYLLLVNWMKEQQDLTNVVAGRVPGFSMQDLAREFVSFTEPQLRQAFRFFHDMGLCFFDAQLDVFIANPQWLARTFSRLISFSHSWVKNGVVSCTDLQHVWKELDSDQIEVVMTLFQKFEVAFSKRKHGYWIVPSMLPVSNKLEGENLLGASVRECYGGGALLYERVFEVHVLPFGLFGRLIARFQERNELIEMREMSLCGISFVTPEGTELGEIVTRTGREGQQQLVVRCVTMQSKRNPHGGIQRGSRKDSVSLPSSSSIVEKSRRRLLIQHVVEECQDLFKAAFGKMVENPIRHFVSCPHCLSEDHTGNDVRFLIPYEKCIELVVSNAKWFDCGVSGVKVPVGRLGDDVTFGHVRIIGTDMLSLGEKIGSGGFGNIYLATLASVNGAVVVKELKAESVVDGFAEFQRETSLMSRLRHSNVVQLFGVMLSPLRMVLEYCVEGDLYHALKSGKIRRESMRLKIALDIACGMAFLHGQEPPLAHCDLRSPNVLLSSLQVDNVIAKVADFGMTVHVTERLRDPLLTWQWMPPEAQLGEEYDERCDLYSFGIVLFEIYAGDGQVPFSEFVPTLRLPELLRQVRTEGLRPTMPATLKHKVMKRLVARLWHGDPKLRPSFCECVSWIKGILPLP